MKGWVCMAVEKKDGKWYIRGKYKLENGKYKDYHRVAKGCKLKKEALKFEENFLKQISGGICDSTIMSPTFEDIKNLYIEEKRLVKKSSSLATDIYMFDIMKELYPLKIHLIKTSTLKEFIDQYNNSDYELSYINKIRTFLNKLFNFAKKKGFVDKNPVEDIPVYKRPDELKKEMQFFTPDQWKNVAKELKKENILFYTMCSMLYFTGMRRGEMLALQRIGDIDMEKRTIRINKTVSQYVDGKRYLLTPPKTQNSYRTIKIPRRLYEILSDYFAWYDAVPEAPRDGFLFGMDLPITPKSLQKYFHKACEKASEPKIRIHDLRHSHATFLINHGANIKAISDRLGNTVDEVLKTYAHLFVETEDAMVSLIDNIF